MMKKWLAIGGLILVTVIWGGGFVASDMALGSMKPFQIMMVRFLLASVLMGMISMGQHKKEGKLEKRAGAIKAGILMGIALFAGFALQIIGLQYTTPSKNAFLTALNVVIVPFIAFIILKKKVGMKGIIGAIMSVIGVALLSLNGNLTPVSYTHLDVYKRQSKYTLALGLASFKGVHSTQTVSYTHLMRAKAGR